MSMTYTKTYIKTTVELPWFEGFGREWVDLQTAWELSGKVLNGGKSILDPFTRTFTRTFVNQAAFDEWHANPIVVAGQIKQRSYEITNNITWTRVITNTDTGTTTTDSSADYSLSLSKG